MEFTPQQRDYIREELDKAIKQAHDKGLFLADI